MIENDTRSTDTLKDKLGLENLYFPYVCILFVHFCTFCTLKFWRKGGGVCCMYMYSTLFFHLKKLTNLMNYYKIK